MSRAHILKCLFNIKYFDAPNSGIHPFSEKKSLNLFLNKLFVIKTAAIVKKNIPMVLKH